MKATPDQIRERFDNDVERFSRLDTGQATAIDSPLHLELIAQAAAAATPRARALLDVGCGAGNYSLRLLETLPGIDVTLLDLSRPMLERARERVGAARVGRITTLQGDIREIDPGEASVDLIVAATVFHHLRGDEEWRAVLTKLHRALRPGGSLWVSDLVSHDVEAVQAVMWRRYGEYLVGLKDEAYRDHVFSYVAFEDSPRSVTYQIDLMRSVGFRDVDILHKNGCFASFGGVKPA